MALSTWYMVSIIPIFRAQVQGLVQNSFPNGGINHLFNCLTQIVGYPTATQRADYRCDKRQS